MKKSIFCLALLGIFSVANVFGSTGILQDDNVVDELQAGGVEIIGEDANYNATNSAPDLVAMPTIMETPITESKLPITDDAFDSLLITDDTAPALDVPIVIETAVIEDTPAPIVPPTITPVVEEVPVIVSTPTSVPTSSPVQVAQQVTQEEQLWQQTRTQNTIEAYMFYLQNSKEHKYALQADEAITQLKVQQDNILWVKSKMTNTIQSYEDYLHNSVQQIYASQAAEAIQLLRNTEENKLWRQAQTTNTIEAYENYLNTSSLHTYDPQAYKAITALKERSEEVMWHETINLNTIAAYQSYLDSTPLKKYTEQATAKIEELQAEAEWDEVKNTMNKSYIQTFLQKYPKSPYCATAEKRIHEITAIDFCNNRQWQSAISEFNAAGGKEELSPTGLFYYNLSMSEMDYQKIANETNQARLYEYISKYPNSEHVNEISNKLALFQSYKFNHQSTEYDYQQALSYAKNDETKAIVEKEIARSKKEIQENAKQEAKQARKERVAKNGGVVNFGFDLLEVGMQMPMEKYGCELGPMCYNFGMNLRFGNFKSPFQFAVGAKIGYKFDYRWFIEGSGYGFGGVSTIKDNLQLPVFAKMKVNLYSGKKSALYIQGTGAYYVNITKQENNVPDTHKGSIAFGVGIAGKHTDWDIISFGHDMQLDENNKFEGSNFRIYTALSFYVTKKVKTKK